METREYKFVMENGLIITVNATSYTEAVKIARNM